MNTKDSDAQSSMSGRSVLVAGATGGLRGISQPGGTAFSSTTARSKDPRNAEFNK